MPFLNKFIEFLKPLPIDIKPLIQLQEKERRKYVAKKYCKVTTIVNELHAFLTYGLLVVCVGAVIGLYVKEKMRQLGIEPQTHVSWIHVAVLFALTPIAFYVCRKIRRYHEKKVEKIYQSLLTSEKSESGFSE